MEIPNKGEFHSQSINEWTHFNARRPLGPVSAPVRYAKSSNPIPDSYTASKSNSRADAKRLWTNDRVNENVLTGFIAPAMGGIAEQA